MSLVKAEICAVQLCNNVSRDLNLIIFSGKHTLTEISHTWRGSLAYWVCLSGNWIIRKNIFASAFQNFMYRVRNNSFYFLRLIYVYIDDNGALNVQYVSLDSVCKLDRHKENLSLPTSWQNVDWGQLESLSLTKKLTV